MVSIPWAGGGRKTGEVENRTLAPWPGFPTDRTDFQTWPERFGDFFEDRYAFRADMIRLASNLRMLLPNYSGRTGSVVRGKDGWMFYSTRARDDTVQQWRGMLRFKPEELLLIEKKLAAWQQWLSERGIHFVLLIPPNKVSIYPEFLPDSYEQVIETTPLDQLTGLLSNNPEIHFVDVRAAIITAKQSGQPLYYKTDTHWNFIGSYYGYQELAKKLAELHPAFRTLGKDDFVFAETIRAGGDLAHNLLLTDQLQEADWPVVAKDPTQRTPLSQEERLPGKYYQENNPDAHSDLSIVVFHDSFIFGIEPFLLESTSQYGAHWDHQLDAEFIERLNPNVVVLQVLERFAYQLVYLDWPPGMTP